MGRLRRWLKRDQAAPDPPQESGWNLTQLSSSSHAITEPSVSHSFPAGVKVLHDGPDAAVDICFVHGLTGDRESTWTARGQSTPWPKTLLPPRLRVGARILTYGYDAYIVRKGAAGSNRLIDHATNLLHDLTTDRDLNNASSRPLIFVAHSLGGLVCKKAILLSRNNPEAHLRGLFDCAKGIVFMGTPHKGSWMADWAKIPASAIGLVKSTNKSLLGILQMEDQLLESIQVDFWSMVRGLREGGRHFEVACFFEELPLPVVGKVVSKESAALEGYASFSIHANHGDMVRFASAEDNGFKRLVGVLARWAAEAGHLRVSQMEKPPRTSPLAAENDGGATSVNSSNSDPRRFAQHQIVHQTLGKKIQSLPSERIDLAN